jgi:tripartite-type tricarboxylate transporter receptor subunit TctC
MTISSSAGHNWPDRTANPDSTTCTLSERRVPTQYIRAGKLRALAVTSAIRLEQLPNIPTVAEFVPGYEATGFVGVGVRRGTPVEVIDRLNKEINAALADPKIKERLDDMGVTGLPLSPANFGKLIADETEKWGKVIRAANIKG